MSITTDQLIAIVSGGAATAAALATFLTVREMAMQRRAAVRPDLVSEQQYAFVYAEQPTSCLRHNWSRERTDANQVLQHSSYAISLTNLGTGAAKRIRSKWAIDINAMVANVNTLARDATIPVSAEVVPGDSDIRILWPDKVIGHQLVANQLEQGLGHLLPVSVRANALEVQVPPTYLTLASLQVTLGLAAGKNVASFQNWLLVPAAKLAVSYLDVHGQSHTKRFHLVLTLLSAGHEGVAHTAGQLPTFMQFMANLNEA